MADAVTRLLLFLALFVAGEMHVAISLTDPRDAIVLASLKAAWQNTPCSWNSAIDPCGSWEGVTCNNNGMVTKLALSNLGLKGYLSDDIRNLTELTSLNLRDNALGGPLPNLTGMHSLNYLDLSNNIFDKYQSRDWLETLPSSITTLLLSNNRIDDGLDLFDNTSSQLQLLDLQNNQIYALAYEYVDYHNYSFEIRLAGNPVCEALMPNSSCCQPQQNLITKPYSTSVANCNGSMNSQTKPTSLLKCSVPTILLLLLTILREISLK